MTDTRYRRAILAALGAGLASFNALYATQALLPSLSRDFGVSPATAALTVSATTGALALAVVPVSVLSERLGRYRVLQFSVLAATLLSLALTVMPSIGSIVALRFLQGIAVAGVPAVTMTYLAEEIAPDKLPRVMGFYVAGTTLGGLLGRLIPGLSLDLLGWRHASLLSAAVAIAIALATAWALPPQRNFQPKRLTLAHEFAAFRRHITHPVLGRLYILPFVMMGAFVSLYNYLGYRLISDFGVAAGLASLVFIMYLSGTWSSARAGALVERWGRVRVVRASCVLCLASLALLLIPALPVTILAVLVFTAAFFATHSVASSWVGAVATRDRGEASSLYILSYYMGSAVLGWVSGFFFHFGWAALVVWLLVLYAVAVAATPSQDVAHTD